MRALLLAAVMYRVCHGHPQLWLEANLDALSEVSGGSDRHSRIRTASPAQAPRMMTTPDDIADMHKALRKAK